MLRTRISVSNGRLANWDNLGAAAPITILAASGRNRYDKRNSLGDVSRQGKLLEMLGGITTHGTSPSERYHGVPWPPRTYHYDNVFRGAFSSLRPPTEHDWTNGLHGQAQIHI